MELKQFQRDVIDELARFLALLGETGDIPKAYEKFWTANNVIVGFGGIEPYQNILPGTPNVCLKVPTGGGKTFIAASALKPIFDALPYSKSKAVVWLVPSDSILEQTSENLSNPHHPYRQKINADFSHRVEVYSKSQLLSGQNFNPTVINEQLSIFVLSYDSFRTSKKDGRKAYQENGSLALFAKFAGDPQDLLADTDETALIQVIRNLNPVLVVDESHHAGSPLSREMLQNFNPSFVLDLTATPKKESNIISYVDASRLKKENMVKLPVIVYNRRSQADVIADAVSLRDKLEALARDERKRNGSYIRPIVLYQAQPKNSGDNTTFDKIKKLLLDIGIPENQIAIKTSGKNELRGLNLLDEKCPIRHIITVNALKEGWDCSFAYVLATVANRTSVVDVEQILGRILRLPNALRNKSDMLNISYVVTSSGDFHETLRHIVTGLNNAGFSDRDYRPSVFEDEGLTRQTPKQLEIFDDFPNVDATAIKNRLAENQLAQTEDDAASTGELSGMLEDARRQAAEYEAQIVDEDISSGLNSAPLEVREYMNEFRMNEEFAANVTGLRLPQFVVEERLPMFSDGETTLLTPEHLSHGFSLRGKEATVDFTSLDAEIASVDVAQDSAPKAWKLTGMDNQFFRHFFNSQTPEQRIKHCKDIISDTLSKKINTINDRDIRDYVRRVIDGLDAEQAEELQRSPNIYGMRIKRKIDDMLSLHAEGIFKNWIEQGKIQCEPRYAFKKTISPAKFTSMHPKSLYKSEEAMNGLEEEVVMELAGLCNIKWWHRNISRTGFNINGYVNAYPDIIAMTMKGHILMIEPKGDHLENSESRQKISVGRTWQNRANTSGDVYRYYMVFKNKDLNIDGAVQLGQFLEIVKGL